MTVMQVIVTGVVVIAVAALLIAYVRTRTLEQIRGNVYQMFLQAEHKYIRSGAGKQKMDEVVNAAYAMLPPWAQLFFTKEILHKIIDAWFSKIKDLLDDGKMNDSHKSVGARDRPEDENGDIE